MKCSVFHLRKAPGLSLTLGSYNQHEELSLVFTFSSTFGTSNLLFESLSSTLSLVTPFLILLLLVWSLVQHFCGWILFHSYWPFTSLNYNIEQYHIAVLTWLQLLCVCHYLTMLDLSSLQPSSHLSPSPLTSPLKGQV